MTQSISQYHCHLDYTNKPGRTTRGAVAKERPANPDDFCRRTFQLQQRDGATWLLDHDSEVAGKGPVHANLLPPVQVNVFLMEFDMYVWL